MKLTDIFPLEITFWTTLWYIFLFYLVAFILFQIYIYVNNLEKASNFEKSIRKLEMMESMDVVPKLNQQG
jgi:hypothetical protein